MSCEVNNLKRFSRAAAAAGFALLVGPSAEAGTFGVPTNLLANGIFCVGNNNPVGSGCTSASSINPPGWLILNGDNAVAGGDAVHQMRLFIEVTGTTLDVKVFDAGSNGIRDVADNEDTIYTLLNPAGAAMATVTVTNDTATTDNRLARMQAATFVAANAGAAFAVTPGLYELRIATEADAGTDEQTNAFGVDIRDGSGNAYNVFTIGRSTAQASAFIGGRWGSSATAPIAEVSAPMPLYAYVEQGCSVIPSNFHAESAGPATIVDALGQSTSLTLSTTNAVAQTLTIETTAAVNQDVVNYGMWPLTHNVGAPAGGNVVDWRIADYRGWVAAPGAAPGNPIAAVRTYLPNSYAPAGGNANAVAPLEPVFRATYSGVSGPNPPVVGSPTRVQINTAFHNAGPGAITNLILQIPLPATGAVLVGSSAVATIDGVAATCAEPGGVPGFLTGSTTAMQCTFTAPIPLNSVAAFGLQADITPAASGLLSVTGPPSLVVSTLSRTGGLATATTAQPHWFSTGDSVTIAGATGLAAFNGLKTITVTGANTFTFPIAAGTSTAGGTITATESGTQNGAVALFTPPYSRTTSITTITRAGTVATATTAAAHGLVVGDTVTVAGSSVTGYNITAAVSSVTATQFTYTVPNSGGSATGGTVTQEARSENAGPLCQLTASVPVSVNLGITKTDAPDPVAAGGDITYTIAVNNPLGGNTAPNVAMADVVPAGTTFQSLAVPAGWVCVTPTVGTTGSVTCTRATLPGNTTSTFTLVVRVTPGTPVGAVIGNTAIVASDGLETSLANNVASASTTVGSTIAPACATGLGGSPGTITGVVNAYFPGTANAALGATSITLGTRAGATTDIAPGDLLLVIQMQDAAIDSTNTAAYGGATNGTTALNNVGRYEYVVATSSVTGAGGAVTLASGLVRGPYTNAASTPTQGQRHFQVVRVPQYATATLTSGLTALPWNGTTGGILAIDVAGNLALGGATVNVSGMGFRGGQGRGLAGGTGTDTDYRNPAAQNVHGSKGEGIAGTPRYVWSVAGGAVDTAIDGYPNGSSARGRPGNAGGGGTDDDAAANTQNSGGGGGANGGGGGRGGNAWNTQAVLGGLGGAAFAPTADRLVLGGGGGAGSRNNSSAAMGSGGAGGGMVFVRTGTVSGTGTITANGEAGVDSLQDGAGGGGAGGSVLVLAVSGGIAGLTVNAVGGDGADAWPLQAPGVAPGERHGPGGGGGGGAVFISSAAAATSVAAGPSGITTTANDPFGALAGVVGSVSLSGALNTTIPTACPLTGAANLAVTKTGNPAALAGGDITYTIVVQNLGPGAAANPTLSESVPTNTTFQSLTPPVGWSCTGVPAVGGTGSFTCTTASLANGGSASFTYVVRVNLAIAGGTIVTNTAAVASNTIDGSLLNNVSVAFTSVDGAVPLLTRATLSGLRVDPEGRVRFATGSQRGTSHFDLFASNDRFRASDLRQVNREPVQAPRADSRGPILYDVQTDPIDTRYLYIVETERKGRRNLMGPFLVDDARLALAYDRVEKSLTDGGAEETFTRGAQSARILASRERRASSPHFQEALERLREIKEKRRERRRGRDRDVEGVKVEVSQGGRVQVTRTDLAAQGLPSNVPLKSVRVTSLGRSIVATVSDDGSSLSFDAEALHTTYTGENVYLLTWRGKAPEPLVPLSMVDSIPAGITRISKRAIYYTYLPGIDPWAWDILYGSTWPASWDPASGTFDLPGLAPSTLPVPFELKVGGGSDHTHIVQAWLNGHPLGEVQFKGQAIATLRGFVDGLQAQGNHLTISYRNAEGDPDAFAVLSHLDLSLPPATGTDAVVDDVAYFSTDLPNFSKVDTLVITHGDFASAAQRFASLKEAEGLQVAVVDVERAYDAFSGGVVEAEAIRVLIQQAAKQSRGLRYVVLIGDDTSDPQDFLALGEASFIPSLYAGEWVASENGFADLNGDGQPDLAIGRLPVRTVEEAEAMVDKIGRQAEALRAGAGRHVFAVDNGSGETSPFMGEAEAVAAQLPSDASISLVDLEDGIVAARNGLESGFAGGGIVHYFGHGGRQIWADENLLDVDAVENLSGVGSVILTWACQAQDYQYFFGHSVNEALVLKPQGGALASFGPAGVTDQAEQALLYGAFYERMRKGGSLGEIIRDAKAGALAGDSRARTVVEGFNLLGDPSIVIAPPAPTPATPKPRKR